MYCPTCGSEAVDRQNYCRKCGANLALVTKAVRIGDTIARGDSGLLPKVKAVVGDLKLDEMSEQIGIHFDKITSEVERGGKDAWQAATPFMKRREKTPEELRAKKIEQGVSGLFGGAIFAVVLYAAGNLIDLQLPPDIVVKLPFDAAAAQRLAWLFGLLPMTTGLGQLIAGFSMRTLPAAEPPPQLEASTAEALDETPPSVTEHTTARLPVHESRAESVRKG
jgi:hypothetical protein